MTVKSLLTRFQLKLDPLSCSRGLLTLHRNYPIQYFNFSNLCTSAWSQNRLSKEPLACLPQATVSSKLLVAYYYPLTLQSRPLYSHRHGQTPIKYKCNARQKQFTTVSNDDDRDTNSDKQLSIFGRFKQVYKEYGKTLIAVHVVTSILWFGGFYTIAYSGIDLMPILIKLGVSEAIRAKFETAGDFLVAYILYEIAKPIRYVVTLAGTQQAVKILRQRGYIPELKPEDRLRSLAKESKDNLKEKYHERKGDFRESYEERKADMKRRWEDQKANSSAKRNFGTKQSQSNKETNAQDTRNQNKH